MNFEDDHKLARETLEQASNQLVELDATLEISQNHPDIYFRLAVGGLYEIAASLNDMTKNLTVSAVQQNQMTRKKAAELLDCHPNTISRWITAAEVEQQ